MGITRGTTTHASTPIGAVTTAHSVRIVVALHWGRCTGSWVVDMSATVALEGGGQPSGLPLTGPSATPCSPLSA